MNCRATQADGVTICDCTGYVNSEKSSAHCQKCGHVQLVHGTFQYGSPFLHPYSPPYPSMYSQGFGNNQVIDPRLSNTGSTSAGPSPSVGNVPKLPKAPETPEVPGRAISSPDQEARHSLSLDDRLARAYEDAVREMDGRKKARAITPIKRKATRTKKDFGNKDVVEVFKKAKITPTNLNQRLMAAWVVMLPSKDCTQAYIETSREYQCLFSNNFVVQIHYPGDMPWKGIQRQITDNFAPILELMHKKVEWTLLRPMGSGRKRIAAPYPGNPIDGKDFHKTATMGRAMSGDRTAYIRPVNFSWSWKSIVGDESDDWSDLVEDDSTELTELQSSEEQNSSSEDSRPLTPTPVPLRGMVDRVYRSATEGDENPQRDFDTDGFVTPPPSPPLSPVRGPPVGGWEWYSEFTGDLYCDAEAGMSHVKTYNPLKGFMEPPSIEVRRTLANDVDKYDAPVYEDIAFKEFPKEDYKCPGGCSYNLSQAEANLDPLPNGQVVCPGCHFPLEPHQVRHAKGESVDFSYPWPDKNGVWHGFHKGISVQYKSYPPGYSRPVCPCMDCRKMRSYVRQARRYQDWGSELERREERKALARFGLKTVGKDDAINGGSAGA